MVRAAAPNRSDLDMGRPGPQSRHLLERTRMNRSGSEVQRLEHLMIFRALPCRNWTTAHLSKPYRTLRNQKLGSNI